MGNVYGRMTFGQSEAGVSGCHTGNKASAKAKPPGRNNIKRPQAHGDEQDDVPCDEVPSVRVTRQASRLMRQSMPALRRSVRSVSRPAEQSSVRGPMSGESSVQSRVRRSARIARLSSRVTTSRGSFVATTHGSVRPTTRLEAQRRLLSKRKSSSLSS